jgi:hypothetical protein
MSIKAVVVDTGDIHHLIVGLNRKDVETILEGNVLTLPAGFLVGLTEQSDVVLLFAETDEDLDRRFPRNLRPPHRSRTPPQC